MVSGQKAPCLCLTLEQKLELNLKKACYTHTPAPRRTGIATDRWAGAECGRPGSCTVPCVQYLGTRSEGGEIYSNLNRPATYLQADSHLLSGSR
jgi:hypothetical protein